MKKVLLIVTVSLVAVVLAGAAQFVVQFKLWLNPLERAYDSCTYLEHNGVVWDEDRRGVTIQVAEKANIAAPPIAVEPDNAVCIFRELSMTQEILTQIAETSPQDGPQSAQWNSNSISWSLDDFGVMEVSLKIE